MSNTGEVREHWQRQVAQRQRKLQAQIAQEGAVIGALDRYEAAPTDMTAAAKGHLVKAVQAVCSCEFPDCPCKTFDGTIGEAQR